MLKLFTKAVIVFFKVWEQKNPGEFCSLLDISTPEDDIDLTDNLDHVQGPCKLDLHSFKCRNIEMKLSWKDPSIAILDI